MLAVLIDYLIAKWQARCPHDNSVAPNDAELATRGSVTQWCKRCGCIRVLSGAAVGEWRRPNAARWCREGDR